ncbi:MAG: 2-amino-4-hydroxy-6-hydroxymethyldihydropteridine diphosphokinase [Anaerolineae bacterium]|nr:2-amino-4-hydroxy-6-hydroxymethyldihydropteridine diphosphokinase [Anaerolineae bacterium]
MTGERHRVFLALGTNLGEREANLRAALAQLAPQVEVTAVSRLYETAPAYVFDQPNFLNIALEGQTDLSPEALLNYLKELEDQLGREKSRRYGPRLIDLDILFFDAITLDSPRLTIPHPRLAERVFVLRPLADIAPDLVHPVLQQSIRALAAALPADDGILSVRPWSPFQAGDAAR